MYVSIQRIGELLNGLMFRIVEIPGLWALSIAIAYKKNGRVFVRSGAGIVADSVPETEYQECINKAKAVVSALTLAQEEDL